VELNTRKRVELSSKMIGRYSSFALLIALPRFFGADQRSVFAS
jgi:hypothetical protein